MRGKKLQRIGVQTCPLCPSLAAPTPSPPRGLLTLVLFLVSSDSTSSVYSGQRPVSLQPTPFHLLASSSETLLHQAIGWGLLIQVLT